MDLLSMYLKGDTEEVYEVIESMGPAAFDERNYPMVEAVLTETFTRVAKNIDIIYRELLKEDYCFSRGLQYDWQSPILKPLGNVEDLLKALDSKVSSIGFVPLCLKFFYRMVGSCNFTWDYKQKPHIPWEGGDPLEIVPITTLLEDLDDRDEDSIEGLLVSADYFHKDNISGGPPYALEITATSSVDGLLLNEEHDTGFINYLRIAMDGCGFSRPEVLLEDEPDYQAYLERVRPLLYPI